MNNSIVTSKAVLLKILEIIEFQEDKDKFIQKIGKLIYEKALSTLIQSLPEGQHETIQQELLASEETSDQIVSTLSKYFTAEQQDAAFEKAAEGTILDYITTIQDTLSPIQREKLADYIESLQ